MLVFKSLFLFFCISSCLIGIKNLWRFFALGLILFGVYISVFFAGKDIRLRNLGIFLCCINVIWCFEPRRIALNRFWNGLRNGWTTFVLIRAWSVCGSSSWLYKDGDFSKGPPEIFLRLGFSLLDAFSWCNQYCFCVNKSGLFLGLWKAVCIARDLATAVLLVWLFSVMGYWIKEVENPFRCWFISPGDILISEDQTFFGGGTWCFIISFGVRNFPWNTGRYANRFMGFLRFNNLYIEGLRYWCILFNLSGSIDLPKFIESCSSNNGFGGYWRKLTLLPNCFL